jgi:hypothetical protein
MHPNGDEVHKVYGDGYEITIKDRNIVIGYKVDTIPDSGRGNLNITINGDVKMNVNGNFIQNVEGNYELTVKGHHLTAVEGKVSKVSKGSQFYQTGGRIELNPGPSLIPGIGGYVNITGDLSTRGEIVANKILSNGRIDANNGISCAFDGFSTKAGGIAVGLAYPIPFSINCTGPINSQTVVSAPYITSALSTTLLGKDLVNGILRNFQSHIAPNGPTSPPTTQELT